MSDFSDATFTGVSLLNGNSVSLTFPTGSMIGFGNTYWWRVRVCTQSSCDSNSGQGYSDWIAQDGDGNALTFTTPDHPFPWANFSYLPLAPIVGTAVSFLDGSTCYGSDQGCTYKWDLGDGTITTDVSPIHPYALKGSKTVNLTVCDEDLRAKYSNPCCPADPQTFTVRSPLGVPEYKEVSPF